MLFWSLLVSLAHAEPTDAIVESGTLVWAGADFSHAKIASKGLAKHPEKVFPAAIEKYQRRSGDEVLLRLRADGAKTILADVGHLAARHTDAADAFVPEEQDTGAPGLSKKDVATIVGGWELAAQDGVGVGVIVDRASAKRQQTCAFPVFFDVESREVLWTDYRCAGSGGSANGLLFDPLAAVGETLWKDYAAWRKAHKVRAKAG